VVIVMTNFRVAVIGVGSLGRHHARIFSAMPGVELVAVVDVDRARADEIAALHHAESLTDAGALAGRVDAVSIAVPTETHRQVALPLLRAGIPVLIEKPMASSLEEADELIQAAADAAVPLAVGHTERFNPAVAAARPLLTNPRFIEAHRLGAFPDRSLDIDVVFDLMIHDLDIILSLVNADVQSIDAVGVPVLTGRVDIANARLRFGNGCIANVTASRISRERVRKIRFFQPAAYLSIDYAAQKIEMWRLVSGAGSTAPGAGSTTAAAGAMPALSIAGGEVPVDQQEPLERELADFVEAVTKGRRPVVDGRDGRRALALAQQIIDRMVMQS
jgi:predicted dehydrogenase